jgi:hypothetical protein
MHFFISSSRKDKLVVWFGLCELDRLEICIYSKTRVANSCRDPGRMPKASLLLTYVLLTAPSKCFNILHPLAQLLQNISPQQSLPLREKVSLSLSVYLTFSMNSL